MVGLSEATNGHSGHPSVDSFHCIIGWMLLSASCASWNSVAVRPFSQPPLGPGHSNCFRVYCAALRVSWFCQAFLLLRPFTLPTVFCRTSLHHMLYVPLGGRSNQAQALRLGCCLFPDCCCCLLGQDQARWFLSPQLQHPAGLWGLSDFWAANFLRRSFTSCSSLLYRCTGVLFSCGVRTGSCGSCSATPLLICCKKSLQFYYNH